MKLQFLILFCLSTLFVFSQNAVVSIDRNIYNAGELINGVLAINGNVNKKVIRISLVDDKDQTVEYSFVEMKNNTAYFNFEVPLDIQNSNYFLIFQTIKENKLFNLVVLEISCLNGLKPNGIEDTNVQVYNPLQEADLMPLNSSKKINENAIYSSVLIHDLNFSSISKVFDIDEKSISTWVEKLFYFGKIEGEKVNQGIAGIYDVNQQKINSIKSDASGQVVFYLDHFVGSKNMQYIPYDSSYFDCKFTLQNNVFTPNKSSQPKVNGTKTLNYFHLLSKINHQFSIQGCQKKSHNSKVVKNLSNPQKNIQFANYLKDESLTEFCKQNNLPLSFIADGNKFKINLDIHSTYSKQFNTRSNDVLFLANGYLTRNYKTIANKEIRKLTNMEIYYDFINLKPLLKGYETKGLVVINSPTTFNFLSDLEQKNVFVVKGFNYEYESAQEAHQRQKKAMTGSNFAIGPTLFTGQQNTDFEIFTSEKGFAVLTMIKQNANGNFIIEKSKIKL